MHERVQVCECFSQSMCGSVLILCFLSTPGAAVVVGGCGQDSISDLNKKGSDPEKWRGLDAANTRSDLFSVFSPLCVISPSHRTPTSSFPRKAFME